MRWSRTRLAARGIRDERVLEAMRGVPRHLFVPHGYERAAYDDMPLPIGAGQTISQPYIVALMTAMLEPGPHDRVLEIGAGSGYQAAVLSLLCERVVTVERLPEVAEGARANLARVGAANVEVHVGDGTQGWPALAPYDGILVTAAAPLVPEPLLEQTRREREVRGARGRAGHPGAGPDPPAGRPSRPRVRRAPSGSCP